MFTSLPKSLKKPPSFLSVYLWMYIHNIVLYLSPFGFRWNIFVLCKTNPSTGLLIPFLSSSSNTFLHQSLLTPAYLHLLLSANLIYIPLSAFACRYSQGMHHAFCFLVIIIQLSRPVNKKQLVIHPWMLFFRGSISDYWLRLADFISKLILRFNLSPFPHLLS